MKKPAVTQLTNLTVAEKHELLALELIIKDGIRTFHEVGRALCHIRDKKLHRLTHANFESYCQERWNFSVSYAYRLIAAAEVVDNVSPIGDIPNEAQARQIGKVAPQQQAKVWQQAQAQADGPPTAARLEQLTRKMLDRLSPEEQQEVVCAAEQSVLARHAAQVGGEQRRDRLAQGGNLLRRAVKIYAGLGDEAEDVIAAIRKAMDLAGELPD